MLRILAVMIVLAGAAGGLVLGIAFRAGGMEPAPGDRASGAGAVDGTGDEMAHAGGGAGPAAGKADAIASREAPAGDFGDRSYVKLSRQIVIPVVKERRTEALMLFELALDVPGGMTERAYGAEPRLRDAFLRTLLEMSYTGAFMETYTDERVTRELRDKLRAEARRVIGGPVYDVLILDMLRQEL